LAGDSADLAYREPAQIINFIILLKALFLWTKNNSKRLVKQKETAADFVHYGHKLSTSVTAICNCKICHKLKC